ncbi:hypothetical protein H6P81_008183 [Aristolochia fimbriata]|uniref:UDP-N-acetylmuramate--L-alanine ligase n=1 Tax=Aristolochia fimbriata TaxID=158543 RepID=A0AAV7F300_ARIFI|nr:hypothetical protein H6P81_008183 [Aristolochia fimbriata]
MQPSGVSISNLSPFCVKFPSTTNIDLRSLPLRFPVVVTSHGRLVSTSPRGCAAVVGPNEADYSEKVGAQEKKQERKGWIHFVGIGGCGLSALAMLALKQGYKVSGSDIMWTTFMDGLQEAGAQLFVGHSVSNIQSENGSCRPTEIVVSSAIPPDNEEILHSNSVEIPVYKRDHWLQRITEQYRLIAVSGTHGKSTTCALLAYVLKGIGDNLTAVIGAHVPQLSEGNIISGHGPNFVLEADEYDGCFLALSPYVAVITSVEWEHVDLFPNEEAVKDMYRRFIQKIREGGILILCGDSAAEMSLLHEVKNKDSSDKEHLVLRSELSNLKYKITTYGTSLMHEWSASSVLPNSDGGSDYTLHHWGHPIAEISIQLPGVHNILNSLAVIATVAALAGEDSHICDIIDSIKFYLKSFRGISRRFERIGAILGCHIYDDYAHHPTEIRATLQAARQMFPFQPIWVVFQPHTYSRLYALMKEFAVSLQDADHVIVTEIYAARERNMWNVSGRDLATSITSTPSEYISSMEDVLTTLELAISSTAEEMVLLIMGAGDINTLGPALLKRFQRIKKGFSK